MCNMQRYVISSGICYTKGPSSLIEFSAQREDYNLNDYLSKKQADKNKTTGVYVHETCRRDYNNRKIISSLKIDSEAKMPRIETRKSTEHFNWLLHCFLCAKPCARDPKHPKRSDCHYASTIEIRNTILSICSQKLDACKDDEWAVNVQRRVYSCIDFVAAEARYYSSCYTRFSTKKQGTELIGRKKNEKMVILFEETCIWLENDINIHSVNDFSKKIWWKCAMRKKRIKCMMHDILKSF